MKHEAASKELSSKKGKKKLKSMHIRPAKGGFTVEHHMHGEMEPEIHVVPGMSDLHKHLDKHLGKAKPEAEPKGETPEEETSEQE